MLSHKSSFEVGTNGYINGLFLSGHLVISVNWFRHTVKKIKQSGFIYSVMQSWSTEPASHCLPAMPLAVFLLNAKYSYKFNLKLLTLLISLTYFIT